MKLTFLMNGVSSHHVGGVKILAEYANRLAERGHSVTIVCAPVGQPYDKGASLLMKLKRVLVFLAYALGWKGGSRLKWLSFHPSISYRFRPTLRALFVPKSDAVISSTWEETEYLKEYPTDLGVKFQLTHEYERFMLSPVPLQERMIKNYQSPIHFVAVSDSVASMLDEHHAKDISLIENAIDLETFSQRIALTAPERCAIGFPYRFQPYKGYQDMRAALDIVHRHWPTPLQFWCYGSRSPKDLPEYVTFYERPTDKELAELMNQTAIFCLPSHFEGFGLPGAEAIACGATLISTDNGGSRSFAIHNQTALVVPPSDPKAIADAILELLTHSDKRIELATQSLRLSHRFQWHLAISAFERLLTSKAAMPMSSHELSL